MLHDCVPSTGICIIKTFMTCFVYEIKFLVLHFYRFNRKCTHRMRCIEWMSTSLQMCWRYCRLSWKEFNNSTDCSAWRYNWIVRNIVKKSNVYKNKKIFLRRLEQNFITEIPPKSFANFKRLRRIDLSNNNISRVAHDAFNGLKSLTTL